MVIDPLQGPEAAQLVADVEDQVSVVLPPLVTLLGFAASDTVGGLAVTETVAELDAEPPGPVHPRMNWDVALSATDDWVPLDALVPVQPPDAVQDVALVAAQVSVVVPPLVIVEGLAEIVTIGVGCVTDTVADWAAVPPAPVQDRV